MIARITTIQSPTGKIREVQEVNPTLPLNPGDTILTTKQVSFPEGDQEAAFELLRTAESLPPVDISEKLK